MLGGVLDPHAAFLLQRGLKTYFVRYRAQSVSARSAWPNSWRPHAAVERTHYPGLPDDPGHALARAQMSDFGAVVSFDLRGGAEAGRRFTDALQLFSMAASVGATDSLVHAATAARQPRSHRGAAAHLGCGPGTVRLSIGLEDLDDLLEDIEQALSTA